MKHDEIVMVERRGVFEPIPPEQVRDRSNWRYEVLWFLLAVLAGLHLFIYDVATGRIANPFGGS